MESSSKVRGKPFSSPLPLSLSASFPSFIPSIVLSLSLTLKVKKNNLEGLEQFLTISSVSLTGKRKIKTIVPFIKNVKLEYV